MMGHRACGAGRTHAGTFPLAGIDIGGADPDRGGGGIGGDAGPHHQAEGQRGAGLKLPILLIVCTLPEQSAEVAALENVIASVHDFPSLEGFAALDRTVNVFFKVSGCAPTIAQTTMLGDQCLRC